MKLVAKSLLLAFFCVGSVSCTKHSARAADPVKENVDGVGNGGDPQVQEFMAVLRVAIDDYETNGAAFHSLASPAELRSLANGLYDKVHFTQDILRDRKGRVRTAVNYPNSQQIFVNEERWKKVNPYFKKVKAIALHELLGLKQLDVEDYKITSAVFEFNSYSEVQNIIARTQDVIYLLNRASLNLSFERSFTRATCYQLGAANQALTNLTGDYLQNMEVFIRDIAFDYCLDFIKVSQDNSLASILEASPCGYEDSEPAARESVNLVVERVNYLRNAAERMVTLLDQET